MQMRSSKGSSGSTSGSSSCQDCGNKAKRDCAHMRCRTCCKSRGFHCPTHVKSTWVPVARRRHHHHHPPLLVPSSAALDHHRHHLPFPLSLSTTTSSGIEGENFPAEVNSLATFRCIRVSSEDNLVDQYAYQTSINIGGHIFKGILYDQGPTTTATSCGRAGGESTSAATSDNHQFHHHQFDIAAPSEAGPPPSSGVNLLYPSPLYSASLNAYLPGMQFFPQPRP